MSNALIKSFSELGIDTNSDGNIKKKFLTVDDLSTTTIKRSKSFTQVTNIFRCENVTTKHPIISNEPIEPSKSTSRRKYIPDDLNRARERTNKQLRPFLETLLAYISAAVHKDKENESTAISLKSALKNRVSIELGSQINLALLKELKRLALDFLLSSSEDLIKGGCVRIMKDVQNLENRLGTKLNNDSIEKQLLVKLLFTLSSYSRVLDYLSTIKDYAVPFSSLKNNSFRANDFNIIEQSGRGLKIHGNFLPNLLVNHQA